MKLRVASVGLLLFLGGWRLAPPCCAAGAPPGPDAAVAAIQEKEEGGGEKKELFFKLVNFLLLIGVLSYVLRKPLGEFFARRSDSIRKSLEEGRKALEASQAQLSAVEEKLRHLEEEIAAFKDAARREMEAEHERLRQAAASEARKILEFAQAQIEAAARAAKSELKIFTAQRALELAEEMVRQQMDAARRKRLVGRFVERVADGSPSTSQSKV